MSRGKPPADGGEAHNLRVRAEARIAEGSRSRTEGPPTPEEAQRLVHELQVHQQELELQNEELRQTRARLEESLAGYTDLFDFAPVGYCVLNASGTILSANLAAATLLGLPRAELSGRLFASFVEPGSRPDYTKFLERSLIEDERPTGQIAVRRKGPAADGAVRQLRLEGRGSVANGERRCLTALVDITEQERLHAVHTASLRENAALYRAIVDSRNIVKLLIDPESGQILEANAAAASYYGRPRDELLGLNLWGLAVEATRKEMLGWLATCAVGQDTDTTMSARHWSARGEARDVIVYPEVLRHGKRVSILATVIDVTERRQMEVRQQSAAIYARGLIEASLDPLVTINADGRISDVNQATEGVTGHRRDQLIGSDFADYFTEPELARAGYQRVFVDGQVRDYPLTIRHSSGCLTDVLFNAAVYRDEAGEIQGIFAAARDITARLQAERQLKESEETLRRAQALGHIGSWRLDRDPEAFEISEEMAKLFDLAEDRTATFSDWFARVHPDDQAAVETAWRAALCGAPYESIYRIVVQREIRWIRAFAELEFDQSGNLLKGVGTVQDITPLKRAELAIQRTAQRLALATEVAAIGIWQWNFADNRLQWDDRLCEWYEVPDSVRQSGLDYAFWRSRVHPDDLGRIEAAAVEAQSSWAGEFRIVLPGGQIRHIDSAAMIERHLDGTAIGMIGVNRDVTAQRALEDALRQAKSAAEVANNAKDVFLANMSHEIRTPMTAILGTAQLLEQELLGSEQRRMLQRIRTAGRMLLGILNDILDFSKLKVGELQLEQRPFDPASITAHLLSLMAPLAEMKRLRFELEGPGEPGSDLMGDARRLEQVLMNLVSNAIKFTEHGTVTLRIRYLERDDVSVRLHFEVADTGIGIRAEDLANLGKPFSQADVSIGRRFGGTGLGLAITKQLLEMMGGSLTIESTPGVGSTFGFELSFRHAPEDAEVTPASELAAAIPGSRLAGRRILLVEDSEMNREVVERALQCEGAAVRSLHDGQQALDALRDQPDGFDAVLMDIQMPGLDGLAATRAIRYELGLTELPVIAFSAGILPNERAEAAHAGMNDFIVKPADLDELFTVLRRWTPDVAHGTSPATPPPTAAATASLPLIKGLDTARAALLLGNDRAFYLTLLRRFVANYGSAAGDTRRDLTAERRDDAVHRMHTLRSNAGSIGALDLAEAATALEHALGTTEADVLDLLARFETELDAVLTAITSWLHEATEDATEPASAEPLDPAQLELLRRALRRREWDAHALFTEMRSSLGVLCGKEAERSLAEAIEGLRFDAALAELNAALGSTTRDKVHEHRRTAGDPHRRR